MSSVRAPVWNTASSLPSTDTQLQQPGLPVVPVQLGEVALEPLVPQAPGASAARFEPERVAVACEPVEREDVVDVGLGLEADEHVVAEQHRPPTAARCRAARSCSRCGSARWRPAAARCCRTPRCAGRSALRRAGRARRPARRAGPQHLVGAARRVRPVAVPLAVCGRQRHGCGTPWPRVGPVPRRSVAEQLLIRVVRPPPHQLHEHRRHRQVLHVAGAQRAEDLLQVLGEVRVAVEPRPASACATSELLDEPVDALAAARSRRRAGRRTCVSPPTMSMSAFSRPGREHHGLRLGDLALHVDAGEPDAPSPSPAAGGTPRARGSRRRARPSRRPSR